MHETTTLPEFDMGAFCDAIDERRRAAGLDWYAFADVLWDQSAQLNAALGDHPLCGGAVSRQRARGATSCQYALYMLRWLGRPPEEFLDGPSRATGDAALPRTDASHRLRFDLPALHAVLNEERRNRGLTWRALADELGCTPARLTNLRSAREADMALTMRVTQWLRVPARDFIRPVGAAGLAPEDCAG